MESHYSENLSTTVFTPLIISATGIVATTIAIVVYHFIVVRFCLTRARIREVIDGSGPIIGQPKGGLDPEKLKAIPILHYSTKPGQPGQVHFRVEQSECAVCLGELEEKVLVRLLPNCRHAFHVQCIDKWLSLHSDCPLCRSLVYPIRSSHVSLHVEDPVSERRRLLPLMPLISPLRREDKSPRRFVLKRSLSVDPSHVFLNILQRECDYYDQYSNYYYYLNKTTSSAVLYRSFSQIQPNQVNGTCSNSRTTCLVNVGDPIPCSL
ncbi:RING-H2 finger protein ATL52-like [Humulus lupulus]|uniref:RING-H2 finger protein ATL52-like n=1 Tax=Humulus lupulus TaxID=3486 RepID=UPI002B400C35|nr:RING-H2 finger protein ATL52-like [Humulus lupulus]